MRIGGFQALTLADFPGKVAGTVFTQGCNFRCGFCHNPELVLPESYQEPLVEADVLNYLRLRQGKLQGVVITGGEPTLQPDLADFIQQVKGMGFLVKLDTNGSQPEVLAFLLAAHLLDYIAMDIKSSMAKMAQVTGVACDTDKIRQSIDLIIHSGIPYQFRTTLVKEFCSYDDLCAIGRLIQEADHYVLQPFVLSPKLVDVQLNQQIQYTPAQIDALKAKFDKPR